MDKLLEQFARLILRKEIYEVEKNPLNLEKDIVKILIVGGSQGSIFFDKQITQYISEKKLSRGFQALVMGRWLDQLEEPETISKKEAKDICFSYIKRTFPKQFKKLL